jgi:hypothetical protein
MIISSSSIMLLPVFKMPSVAVTGVSPAIAHGSYGTTAHGISHHLNVDTDQL